MSNKVELTERKFKNMVREELAKYLKSRGKENINEVGAFRADKMRELISRKPRLQWIVDNEGLDIGDPQDLKVLYDREVMDHASMEREYDKASPQPTDG